MENKEKHRKTRVLVVGQVPPPIHGQSLAIENIVNSKSDNVIIDHLPIDFNKDISEVSKFSLSKLVKLFRFRGRLNELCKNNYDVIYYPPPPPKLIAIIRDFLIFTFFKLPSESKWVYHVHAGGLPEYLGAHKILKALYIKIVPTPAHIVELSDDGVSLVDIFSSSERSVIPYGVFVSDGGTAKKKYSSDNIKVLFIGNIYEDKGVDLTIRVIKDLKEKGHNISLDIMGGGTAPDIARIENLIQTIQAKEVVNYHGVLSGEKKWSVFNQCDYVCFPSYYHNEKLPIVLIEALGLGKPVISTTWRGIPEIITKETGCLVEPKSYESLLVGFDELLSRDYDDMSVAAKNRFANKYTLSNYQSKFHEVFVSL